MVTRSEYGTRSSSTLATRIDDSRSASPIAWRGVASRATASRLTGLTSAARLTLARMRSARSATEPANHGGRSSPSPLSSRQPGAVASRCSPRWIGSPKDSATLPYFLRSTPSVRAQAQDRFLLLGLARQLADVRAAFDQLLVADVDRLEHHRPARLAQEAAHGHRQHAGARLQQPAGAAAPALDEVLDRHAAREELRHVLGEHGRVQRVGAEAAPQEEGAAAAQDRAHHRQVEVHARRRCAAARCRCT